MPLTHKQVQNARPGRHSDGRGLYLLVKPTGGKSWVLRVQHGGHRRDFGLGSVVESSVSKDYDRYPIEQRRQLTLDEARKKAALGRELAKHGKNPSAVWRVEEVETRTFEEAAREYHKQVAKGWRVGKHRDQWINTLEAYAFPALGKLNVEEIDASAMQRVLLPIWLTKGETARRVKQRIGVVLDYAHGQGWRSAEAPMRALNQLLRGIKQPRGGNFDAMPYADLPGFMAKLREADQSVGRLALQFLILTVARSGEVRKAKWNEIDFDAAEWRVPAVNTKTGRPHIVPLVPEAMAILEQMRGLFGGDPKAPIFPGNKGKPLSDATLAKALRVTGGAGTVHGLRSTFRDWAAETGQPDAWAEAALSHGIPDKVEAAYRRTTYFAQRRDILMPAWAAFVHGPTNLVSLADRRA